MSEISSQYEDDEDDCFIDWTYEVFNDKYIMIKKLGKGSYCSVWLAYNYIDNNFIALKVYNRCDYKRGKKELLVFDKLKSKKICNIVTYNKSFDFEHDDYDDEQSIGSGKSSSVFLCVEMELCGYSLYDIIKLFRDRDNDELKPPPEYYYNVVKNTITILNDIHSKGFVHSDIKPENILLKKPSYETFLLMNKIKSFKTGKFIKITNKNINDFVKKIKGELKNKINTKLEDEYKYIFNGSYETIICDMGTTVIPNDSAPYKKYTIYYRAPETILKLNFNHTYDYWSFGCTLYEILTETILFNANNDLELLYLFMCKLGPIPKNLIDGSEYKKKFFTTSGKRIRGYKKIVFDSIYEKFQKFKKLEDKLEQLIKVMLNCLNYEADKRSLDIN
jgi:serine/threonine-protein kinase SRPK3